MNAYPDEAYLVWLYGQMGVSGLKNPARTHWSLAKQLYTKEFIWLVPNDDNRVSDGKDLRNEFIQKYCLSVEQSWMDLGCSMLEMLIALSRRLFFLTDIEPREWFWEMLENADLGMANTNDQHYNAAVYQKVDEVLDRVIWRTYAYNGDGGLFPLSDPKNDQREVELWYQLSTYLAPDM